MIQGMLGFTARHPFSFMVSEKRRAWRRNYEKVRALTPARRAYMKQYARSYMKRWRTTATGKAYQARPDVKVASASRQRTCRALKGFFKTGKTFDLIGCTPAQLKLHLEAQFKLGMNWENRSAWHIDHITPISFYDLTKAEEQAQAFHWSNLQPLWSIENLQKGAKV